MIELLGGMLSAPLYWLVLLPYIFAGYFAAFIVANLKGFNRILMMIPALVGICVFIVVAEYFLLLPMGDAGLGLLLAALWGIPVALISGIFFVWRNDKKKNETIIQVG